MKTHFLLLSLLISGCGSSTSEEPKIFDYSDVVLIINWLDIFNQPDTNYSVYFFNQTCGHCNELKQEILTYYFENYEKLYFVETDDNTIFGPQNDLTGIDSIDEFFIFGTPFLINVDDYSTFLDITSQSITMTTDDISFYGGEGVDIRSGGIMRLHPNRRNGTAFSLTIG